MSLAHCLLGPDHLGFGPQYLIDRSGQELMEFLIEQGYFQSLELGALFELKQNHYLGCQLPALDSLLEFGQKFYQLIETGPDLGLLDFQHLVGFLLSGLEPHCLAELDHCH